MFRADLHCHSTCSDGTFTPEELIHHAREKGLQGLCITDHDTIDAYKTALPIAKSLGILLGVGIEFSSLFQGLSVHILGYDFDLNSSAILALCKRHVERRQERNRHILKRLEKLNMKVTEEELLMNNEKIIGRPHIAKLMVQKGYVDTIKDAFDLYIGDERPCFELGEGISAAETVAVIHEGGGKAFMAHPHLFKHQNKIKELLKLPFDGIECYYARSQPHVEGRYLRLAKEKNLLISGGSDFHGSLKEHIPLGCSWVDEAHFNQIFQRL